MLSRACLGRALLTLFSLLATASGLPAMEMKIPAGPYTIEADRIGYDGDRDVFSATGKVRIGFAGGFLTADRVTLDRGRNLALAEGQAVVQSDQDVLEGEKIVFDLVAGTGLVVDGRMFIDRSHIYISAAKIEKTGEATYRLEDAAVTTCDGETPDWRLSGSELDLTVDGYGILKHGRFLARDIPVFYLPYLIFPAKTTRQTGLLFPRFSYSRDKNGLDAELPFYWAVSESADATFFQRYLEKRGFKEGLEIRYVAGPDAFGVFYGDWILDQKRTTETVAGMSRDWQEDRNRWSYYLNQEMTFASGIHLRSDIRRVSDHWYFRDFSSFNYYREHASLAADDRFRQVSFAADESLGSLDSAVRLVKDWSLYNLTALARYTDDFASDSNDATLQKYPELILTGFRRPLSTTPLQLEFTAGYDYLYRTQGQKGHLWELAPNLYLPFNLGSVVQMTPHLGFRGSLWERDDSPTGPDDKRGQRGIAQFGAVLSAEGHRIYDTQSRFAEKVRHGIKPEIVYTFIPGTAERIPDFLEPIPGRHSLTFALTNTLLARLREPAGKVRYREMMRFKLAQTYDIREARRDAVGAGKDNRPFGDVSMELDLAPLDSLSLAVRNIYSVNSGDWKQSNYDLAVSDRKGNSLSAGYRYTRDTIEEINLSLKASLTSSLEAIYILRQNRLSRRTIESSYGVKYWKQCWNVELSLSDREDDRTIMAIVSLYGMGTGGAR
jgi:LPS-assembly protein